MTDHNILPLWWKLNFLKITLTAMEAVQTLQFANE